MRRALLASVAALVALSAATPAQGGDPFEVQVYDGTANAPGVPGLELHLNDWATGHREAPPPEAPLHGQFHATLEPSYGITPVWELGAYLQGAIRTDDGAVDWAGVKLRSKFVTPEGWDPHWRLGVNLELSYLPPTYDASQWGSEVRPIVAYYTDRWLFALNPILDQSLASPGASAGPSFQPALKAAATVGPVALGFEYYATIDRLFAGNTPSWRDQEHYLYEVVDLLAVEHFELNVGLGEGLTHASEGLTAKVIVGYEFEGAAARTETRP